MDPFFETPEQVAAQLDEARQKLKEFEENTDTEILMSRLRVAHPAHPALLARGLFLFLAVLAFLTTVGFGAVPFVTAPPSWLIKMDASLGMPLPVPIGVLALCFLVAWLGAGQAALAIARDCPMLPEEQKLHEKFVNEVKRLTSQKAIMDRVRNTPMGARPRTATPPPTVSRHTSAPTPPGPSSRNLSPVGPPSRAPLSSTPPWASRTAPEPSYSAPESGRRGGFGEPSPEPPRGGGGYDSELPVRPPPSIGASLQSGPPVGRGNKPAPLPPPKEPEPRRGALTPMAVRPDDLREGADGDGDGNREYVSIDVNIETGNGYEQKFSSDFPKWGVVEEEFLQDAIEKSQMLAGAFPVQAHLHYSADASLPFVLVIERATPAMAVRAMMSYTEFLASITTPRFARIEVRGNFDRGFQRQIETALDKYFAGKYEIEREGNIVDIAFTEYDTQWDAHPQLPIV